MTEDNTPDGNTETDGAKQCPACGAEVTDPNLDMDHWYCESSKCEVVLFGPRGLTANDHS